MIDPANPNLEEQSESIKVFDELHQRKEKVYKVSKTWYWNWDDSLVNLLKKIFRRNKDE